jgi:hypothetical protein
MDTLAMADEAVASRRRRVLLPFVRSERLVLVVRDAPNQAKAAAWMALLPPGTDPCGQGERFAAARL